MLKNCILFQEINRRKASIRCLVVHTLLGPKTDSSNLSLSFRELRTGEDSWPLLFGFRGGFMVPGCLSSKELQPWKTVAGNQTTTVCFHLFFSFIFEALSHLPCGTASDKLKLSTKVFAYVCLSCLISMVDNTATNTDDLMHSMLSDFLFKCFLLAFCYNFELFSWHNKYLMITG